MKKVSICIPCYNEVGNVQPLSEELVHYMEQMPQYDFEIIFSDNCSTDGTQDILRKICSGDKRIKAIFNSKNYPSGSGLNVIYQASGDCIIFIPSDFQVPVMLVPKMIMEWEKGADVVALIKETDKHDKIRVFRKLYYKISGKLTNQAILPGFTGSGLFNRSFIELCRSLNDPLFSMQYMIVHYVSSLVKLNYTEKPRRSGKSKNNFLTLIYISIIRFIYVSDIVPHLAIIAGLSMGIISFLISIYYLVRKLLDWQNFPIGIAPLIIGVFFLGAIQLIFIGLIGEYVIMINERQKNKPLVLEKERINFVDESVKEF
jgi:glycosyltransferase involved in cell wall biosynthesis